MLLTAQVVFPYSSSSYLWTDLCKNEMSVKMYFFFRIRKKHGIFIKIKLIISSIKLNVLQNEPFERISLGLSL